MSKVLVTQAFIASNQTCQSRVSATFARLRNWRGGWALGDQAVASLGNYLTLFIIPNFLPAEQFGVFSLMFGVLLFLNTIHNALVAYPFSLRAATAPPDEFRPLLGSSLALTALLLIPLSAGVCVAAALLKQPWLIPLALPALALWQVQENLRRAHMSRLNYAAAIPGDAVSYLGQAALLLTLGVCGHLSLYTAFVAMTVTSGLSIAIQVRQLAPTRPAGARLGELGREFWSVGRWVVCSAGVGLLSVQAMPWTLATFHGTAAVARFQMLANLLALSNPLVIGLTSIIVPSVARAANAAGLAICARYTSLGLVILLPYFALLVAFPAHFLAFAYRGLATPESLATPLRLFAVAYAMIFPAHMAMAFLNGLGRTRLTFVANCVFAGSTALVSLPLAARFGIAGAVWGGLFPALAYLVTAINMVRNTHRPADADRLASSIQSASKYAPPAEVAA